MMAYMNDWMLNPITVCLDEMRLVLVVEDHQQEIEQPGTKRLL